MGRAIAADGIATTLAGFGVSRRTAPFAAVIRRRQVVFEPVAADVVVGIRRSTVSIGKEPAMPSTVHAASRP